MRGMSLFYDTWGPEARRRRGREQAKAHAQVTPGRWLRFDPVRGYDMPTAPAVYAVYFGAELVYVGQTSNLRERFGRHNIRYGFARNIITPWGSIPDISPVSVKAKLSRRYGDWAMIELRLIKRLQPRLNSQFAHGRKPGRVA